MLSLCLTSLHPLCLECPHIPCHLPADLYSGHMWSMSSSGRLDFSIHLHRTETTSVVTIAVLHCDFSLCLHYSEMALRPKVCVLLTGASPMLRKFENIRERDLESSLLWEMETVGLSEPREKQGSLWKAVPPPHGETKQCQQSWKRDGQPYHFYLPQTSFLTWSRNLNRDKAGIMTSVIRWSWIQGQKHCVRSLHNDEECNPQWR